MLLGHAACLIRHALVRNHHLVRGMQTPTLLHSERKGRHTFEHAGTRKLEVRRNGKTKAGHVQYHAPPRHTEAEHLRRLHSTHGRRDQGAHFSKSNAANVLRMLRFYG